MNRAELIDRAVEKIQVVIVSLSENVNKGDAWKIGCLEDAVRILNEAREEQ